MTHDPLCPVRSCQCELISKVRKDDLRKVEGVYLVNPDGTIANDGDWNMAVRVATEYLAGTFD